MERIFKQVGKICDDKAERELRNSNKKLNDLMGSGKVNEENLIKTAKETNQWIDYCAGTDNDIYDKYRFRLFKLGNRYFLAQGDEIRELDVRRGGENA